MKKIGILISILIIFIFFTYDSKSKTIIILGELTLLELTPGVIYVCCLPPYDQMCATCGVDDNKSQLEIGLHTDISIFKHNVGNQSVGVGHTHANVDVSIINGEKYYKITPLPGDQVITNYNVWLTSISQ